MRVTIFFFLLITFNSSLYAQWWKTYPFHKDSTFIYFPQDEGYHADYRANYGTEWWYANFHLRGETTNTSYSAMVAYFNYNFRIFNITDESNDEFHSFFDLGMLNVSPDFLDLKFYASKGTEYWFVKTDTLGNLLPFQYHLSVGDDSYNLNIDLDAQKPPLIIGMDGLVTVGTGNSYYYSQTNLAVTGELTFGGFSEPVSGIAWIDHQYGPFFISPGGKESYEWFSLQLDNGMDINLWNIFTADNKIPPNDSHRICTIYINEQTQDTTSTFNLERLAFREYSNKQYFASKWRFTDPIHKIDLIITPVLPDQVVPFFDADFWEGSCSIAGKVNDEPVSGVAFAELLHLYELPIITILSPNGGELLTGNVPITWKLVNPDDGNPLKYDVYYCTESDSQFVPIVSGISDTSYFWDISALPEMDSCLIKVVGYSIDSTIIGEDISDGIFSIKSSLPVDNWRESTPATYKLFQNYPNPFNKQTIIQVEIKKRATINLKICNIYGELVKTLLNGTYNKGSRSIAWDGTDYNGNEVSSGIYLYRISSGPYIETKRMLLLK